jgi:enoyl-CoA hydratase
MARRLRCRRHRVITTGWFRLYRRPVSRSIDTGTDNLTAIVDDSGILRIELDNPKSFNSLTALMLSGLQTLFTAASNDPDVRAILVRGSGDKAFASGANIGEHSDRAESGTTNPDRGGFVHRLLTCSKPVVAMIHGYCLGGGLLVALTADFRLAADDARFSIPATRLGVAYPLEATELLVNIVGRGAATSMLLSGDRFGAVEAHRIGLVTAVSPKATLETTTETLLATLAANAPLSMAASKESLAFAVSAERPGRAKIEATIDAVWGSADAKEGMDAFFSKRDPEFKGR